MCRFLPLLLLLCAIRLGAVEDNGNRLSITFSGETAGSIGGIIGTMSSLELTFDDQLIGDSALYLNLHQASRQTVLQAVAHACAGWWWYDIDEQRYRISASTKLSFSEGPVVRSHPTSLVNRYDIEPIVMKLMEPWLGQKGSGIASIPWTGQWTATLDPSGQAQLTAILRTLEIADYTIPSPMPVQDLPDPAIFSKPTTPVIVNSDNWAKAMLAAAKHFQFTIALSPAVVQFPSNKTIDREWPDIAAFAAALRAEGFQAQWVAGVLCVDLLSIQRRAHPVLARRIILLPIPQLVEGSDGHLIAAGLQQATATIPWQEGGRLCAYIATPPRLLIAVEGTAVNSILDALDRFERSGGSSWDGP